MSVAETFSMWLLYWHRNYQAHIFSYRPVPGARHQSFLSDRRVVGQGHPRASLQVLLQRQWAWRSELWATALFPWWVKHISMRDTLIKCECLHTEMWFILSSAVNDPLSSASGWVGSQRAPDVYRYRNCSFLPLLGVWEIFCMCTLKQLLRFEQMLVRIRGVVWNQYFALWSWEMHRERERRSSIQLVTLLPLLLFRSLFAWQCYSL